MVFEMVPNLNRILSFAKNKVYSFFIFFLVPLSYSASGPLRESYRATRDLVDHPHTGAIDQSRHLHAAQRAVDNYKLAKDEKIPEIYQPGQMWKNILENVLTYRTWKLQQDDRVLYDALYQFYRSDLVQSHSGDIYIWEIENNHIDLKKQVFMIIRRYRAFISRRLSFDYHAVTTTDVGQNIYVDYEGKKITFKVIRFAHYLDRIIKNLHTGPDSIIGELGVGAGELSILTKKVLPGCRYICFDLPETLMVASYNIMMTSPDKKIGLYQDFAGKGKITREVIRNYDCILLPNWCIDRVEDDALDLFINIASLSEMDRPIIKNYIENIERVCNGHMYTVNRNVKGVAQFGAEDIALEEFPFSEKSRIISAEYDVASDMYHQRYGMDYECFYWEFIVKLR